jgi:hypothetical protein
MNNKAQVNMKMNHKHHHIQTSGLFALCVVLSGNISAEAAPFDASNSLDPFYSGQSEPYGRPAAAIGEGFGGQQDDEPLPEGAVTEDDSTRFIVYPAIGATVTWDDNFYAEPDNTNSATIFRIRPAVGINGANGINNFRANYVGVYSSFDIEGGSEQDSVMDHNLNAIYDRQGEQVQGGAGIAYRIGHNEKGGIEDNVDYFDEFEQANVNAWVNFGKRQARFNLRLDARTGVRVQKDLSSIDVNGSQYSAMLKARLGNKTHGVFEVGTKQTDYENSNQSANTVYGRLGLTWQASAKTTGFITYGREQYNPDNPGEEIESDEEGPAFGVIEESTNSNWRGAVNWEATLNDSLLLATTRGTRISSGTGSHKVATRNTAAWTHLWSERIRSNVGFLAGEDEFKGTTRVDDLIQYQISLSYNIRRDMLFSGGWYYTDRESTVVGNDYDRNRFILNYNWKL